MTAADTRTPPIPAGTLCKIKGGLHNGDMVRVYATIQVGASWDGIYRCHVPLGGWLPGVATRDQLEVIR